VCNEVPVRLALLANVCWLKKAIKKELVLTHRRYWRNTAFTVWRSAFRVQRAQEEDTAGPNWSGFEETTAKRQTPNAER
jgi:hypothetical protein